MDTSSKPQKRPAHRLLLNRILNLLLWLSFCAISGTGLLLAFRLVPGSEGGHGLTALGLDRHGWGGLHNWIGYFFIGAIFLHLALHWRWLWQVAARKHSWPMWLGIGFGILILLALLFQPVQHTPSDTNQPRSGQHDGNSK